MYENAPATKMLATHCLCCMKALLDSVSIETGMGPVCRKRHGFNKPDVEVALEDACEVCVRLPEEVAASILRGACTTRELANRVVYRAAAMRSGGSFDAELFAAYVRTLAGIGFKKLSVVVGKAVTVASLTSDGALIAPYDPRLLAATRSIPGRRWDAATKTTYFHMSALGLVARALVEVHGAAAIVSTDEGLRTAGELAASLPVVEAPAEPETKPSVRVARLGAKLLALHAPYDAAAVAEIKTIPGRRWDASARCWTIPASERRDLRRVLERRYAGRLIEVVDGEGKARVERIGPEHPLLATSAA